MKYYVVGVYPGDDKFMLLTLEGYDNVAEARRAVRWQEQGGFGMQWHVAIRSGPDTFRLEGCGVGEEVTAHQSPYTKEAWDAFKAEYKS